MPFIGVCTASRIGMCALSGVGMCALSGIGMCALSGIGIRMVSGKARRAVSARGITSFVSVRPLSPISIGTLCSCTLSLGAMSLACAGGETAFFLVVRTGLLGFEGADDDFFFVESPMLMFMGFGGAFFRLIESTWVVSCEC